MNEKEKEVEKIKFKTRTIDKHDATKAEKLELYEMKQKID